MLKHPAAIAAIIVAIAFGIIVFAIVVPIDDPKQSVSERLNSCVANCPSDLIKTIPTNNPRIKLGLLFEHDGCSIYRFVDGSWTNHYYIKCNNGTAGQIQ